MFASLVVRGIFWQPGLPPQAVPRIREPLPESQPTSNIVTPEERQSPETPIAAANQQRDAEFERVALPWMNDVYRFAYSLTRNETDAQDLVQETYLRAFRSWHTFQPGSDARRWLFTICRNAFLRSRERTRHEVDLEDGDTEALALASRHGEMLVDGTDRVLTQIDLRPALRSALEQLHEPFRSAVILVDVEDQSYDAAAEILGVPIGTVRSRLFRGRRQLQERLALYAKDAGFASAGTAKEKRQDD